MRIKLNIAVWIMLFFVLFIPAAGATAQSLIDDPLQGIDLQLFDDCWQELQREIGDYLPEFQWRDLLSWFRDGETGAFRLTSFFGGLARYLFRELLLNINLLGQLIILAVAAALLKNIQKAFCSQGVEQLSQSVVFIVLMGLAIKSLFVAMEIGTAAINRMVDFILALIPILVMLLASLGSFSSAAIFHPLIVFSANFFSNVVREVLFPLIFFATILTLLNYFSPAFKLQRLADFLKSVTTWTLGLLLTVFVGLLSIQGAAGTVTDAVGLRTAKFATATLIPVVGKIMSEAVETVAGVSLLLKNCINVTGLIMLFIITAFPLIKLFSLIFIYKLVAALIQPLGETSLGDCLDAMGNCLILVFIAVTAVSLLFFIAVAVIMGSGNALLMLR